MKPALTILILALLGVGAWFLIPGAPASQAQPSEPQPETSHLNPSKLSPQPKAVPHLIHQLTNPALHQADQVAALHDLPSDLTVEELAALLDLLRKPAPSHLSSARWYNLQNEIMVVLRDPKLGFSDYPAAMSALVDNRNIDPIVRDYAAQHLSLYLLVSQGTLDPKAFDQSLASLFGALDGEREAYQPVSGTALMSLCDLYEKVTHPDCQKVLEGQRTKLAQTITQITSGAREVANSLRISAIQAAGRLQVAESLPIIRDLASGESPEPLLRISAIASLGYYQDPADKDLLETIAESQTKHRFAAQAALKKFPLTK